MPRPKDPNRLIATAERDRRVIELRRASWAWREIASEVGLSMSRCHQIFEEYRKDIPASVAAAYRAEELDLLGRGIQDLLKLALDAQVSPRTRAELWREVRQHGESRRRMLGIDAPLRRELEIVDLASEEARMNLEMAQMEAEIRAHDALNSTDPA